MAGRWPLWCSQRQLMELKQLPCGRGPRPEIRPAGYGSPAPALAQQAMSKRPPRLSLRALQKRLRLKRLERQLREDRVNQNMRSY